MSGQHLLQFAFRDETSIPTQVELVRPCRKLSMRWYLNRYPRPLFRKYMCPPGHARKRT